MAIVDSKGRLFGKVSIIDFGAALVILLVVVGIFFFPGESGSVAQLNSTKPVEVDIIVRGLSLLEPDVLVNQLEETKKTNIVIRKQPYGQVDVKSVKILRRSVLVPQPDGSIKELPEITPNGQKIITAGNDNLIKIWDLKGNPFHTLKGHTQKVWDIAI
ncbi:DUF4330 family protein, partial [Moorena sp. SIO1F2]|uniref:DUF4330 family protein n=1 Tax=Moorena sp. SIO1F2 TaxID=2607819 RepID=UPI00260053AA